MTAARPTTGRRRARRVLGTAGAAGVAALLAAAGVPAAQTYLETPMLTRAVAAGELPPVDERLPRTPLVVTLDGARSAGRHGGDLRMLIGRARDLRLLVVYGYARLVGYDESYRIVPDILESVDAVEDRIFTLRLRKGHRWSDGHPFTAEDFRYYWEDMANHDELAPKGPPRALLVEGRGPRFAVIDRWTVRYSWHKANPFFLPALAAATPLFLYRPAHYLKRFHLGHRDKAALNALVREERLRSWVPLHFRRDRMYKFDNPELPTLQPWRNTTAIPATRFVAERNPYFHRVDRHGRQLPYIDRVVLVQADSKLIAAKAGAGEVDLQSRSIFFNNFTFLKANEARNGFTVRLWRTAKGAHFALFPNLNVNDPVWRKLVRDVRFRRALSLAIDRTLVNRVLYFGLADEGNNTVLPESPLYEDDYRTRWALYDIDRANALLDELGLRRRADGLRVLPDGRLMDVIVETAGEKTEESDILELIRETWLEAGIRLFTRPLQREVFRNRIYAGETLMSVWSGLENGLPTPDMSPAALAPTAQVQLQWPKWGQHYESSGRLGEAPDLPLASELLTLDRRWLTATGRAERRAIWKRMLEIHADRVFTIGVVAGVRQPIVVRNALRNVPVEGIYNWNPGAQFGIYRPDTFWLDPSG